MENDSEDTRLGELLMQRATGALSAPEADALAQALAKLPPGELARWERAAAELAAAFAAADPAMREAMPDSLAARVISSGEAIVRSEPRVLPIAAPAAAALRSTALAWTGWFAAAAAVTLWLAVPRTNTPSDRVVVAPMASTPMQLRDSLLAADSATDRLAWTATKDSSARSASGDVVWSARAQRGVMHIVGLQANDRSRWQYQLWIFDKTRDEKYPVDGGVFDIPAGQTDVYVPIDARVPVGDAVMFAITVEPAGGVVVSTRERIALLATRKS
ncbi:MAG: anti-sigma factor [Gemmatimonadaceae bacterium]|nr:anti-sigma factor [Gemmatimonadaceae bacterium]